MKLTVEIDDRKEAVEDWVQFRDRFEQAAEELGLTIDEIVHVKARS